MIEDPPAYQLSAYLVRAPLYSDISVVFVSILSPQSLPARRNQFIALFYIAQSTIGSFAMYAQNIIYFAKRMPLEN